MQMKFLTEYTDLKTGNIMGDEVEASSWIEAQKICSKRRINETVIGEHILTIEVNEN